MGRGRRRTWRKLHLGVGEETKEIVAVDLTTSGIQDSAHLPVYAATKNRDYLANSGVGHFS